MKASGLDKMLFGAGAALTVEASKFSPGSLLASSHEVKLFGFYQTAETLPFNAERFPYSDKEFHLIRAVGRV